MNLFCVTKRVGNATVTANLLTGNYYLQPGKGKKQILIGHLQEDCVRKAYRPLLLPESKKLPDAPLDAPASPSTTQITVAMPAYNAAAFISKAIESVLAQTYDNFELLIIDDGSTDNTPDIINSYSDHQKIRWLRQKHQGIGKTRNRLLRLAAGDYISLCDADDTLLPDKLKTHAKILDINSHAAVVYGDVFVMNKRGTVMKNRYLLTKDMDIWWDLLENAVMNCGATFRKKAALIVGGYDEAVSPAEDYDLWLKLAEIYAFCYLPRVCAVYRSYPQSNSRTDKHIVEKVVRVKKHAILRRYGGHLESIFTW